jgi:hypothetical protein
MRSSSSFVLGILGPKSVRGRESESGEGPHVPHSTLRGRSGRCVEPRAASFVGVHPRPEELPILEISLPARPRAIGGSAIAKEHRTKSTAARLLPPRAGGALAPPGCFAGAAGPCPPMKFRGKVEESLRHFTRGVEVRPRRAAVNP